MKTPEQMAKEYGFEVTKHTANTGYYWVMDETNLAINGFLAGYQAAKDEDKAKVQELEANWKFCCEDKARLLNELAVAERAKDQLADADKVMPHWISVKERLPKEAQEVLIYTERRDIYMARIYKDNEAYPFSNGCGCCGSEERYTHWMLPEAPEGEG